MPTISLEDLLQRKATLDAKAYREKLAPTPHSFQQAPPEQTRVACSNTLAMPEPEPEFTPTWLAEAFAKLDALSARCDAIIERNGRWTRYVTNE